MNNILSLLLAATIPLIYAQAAHAESLNDPAVAADQSSGRSAGMNSSMSPTRFETVPPGEAGQIGDTVSLTMQLLEKRYGDTLARRGVHPKDHGCVKAHFTVNPDIPEIYRVGVFAKPGKIYDAWIRFSNATGTVAPDVSAKGANGRGMAIKLMGVEGDTLLGEQGAKTQDFLLINQPMFAFPNVSEYRAANQILLDNNEDLSRYFAPPLSDERKKTAVIVQGIAKTQLANPLDAQYFSASPFLFGKDKVAKFSAKPRDPANPSLTPTNPSDNYLRMAMKQSLDFASGQPAVFDFQVQLRPNGTEDDLRKSYPIEDASAKWEETPAAPFKNVAVISINRQNFDYPLQVTECEHLVFTPWHGLAEHQPLGGINRLRLQVYIASSQHRAQAREPSGFPKWPF